MINKKKRRHSGRKVTKIYDPVAIPYEETKWDDWNDRRDGFRGSKDHTLIQHLNKILSRWYDTIRFNDKNKKLISRRKARQLSPRNSNKRFKY